MMRMCAYLLLLIVLSCGKAPKEPTFHTDASGNPIVTPEAIVGKSKAEILKLKYNDQISLKCQVEVNSKLVDQFVWDIPHEMSLLKILKYKVNEKEISFLVRISAPVEFKDRVSYTDENLVEYHMEYSPVMSILFQRASKKILQNGSVHDLSKYQEKTLFENVEDIVHQTAFEEVKCTLATQPRAGFEHQWMIVK